MPLVLYARSTHSLREVGASDNLLCVKKLTERKQGKKQKAQTRTKIPPYHLFLLVMKILMPFYPYPTCRRRADADAPTTEQVA